LAAVAAVRRRFQPLAAHHFFAGFDPLRDEAAAGFGFLPIGCRTGGLAESIADGETGFRSLIRSWNLSGVVSFAPSALMAANAI